MEGGAGGVKDRPLGKNGDGKYPSAVQFLCKFLNTICRGTFPNEKGASLEDFHMSRL